MIEAWEGKLFSFITFMFLLPFTGPNLVPVWVIKLEFLVAVGQSQEAPEYIHKRGSYYVNRFGIIKQWVSTEHTIYTIACLSDGISVSKRSVPQLQRHDTARLPLESTEHSLIQNMYGVALCLLKVL